MYQRWGTNLLGGQRQGYGYHSATRWPVLDYVFGSGATTLAEAEHNFAAITFTRGSSGTHFDSSGILQTASTNAARFDHDPVTGSPLGLLIEKQRENICLQSNDLNTTWTNPGGNTTITANAGTAANGTATADDVKHDDSAETIQQTITVTDNTVTTISAVIQQGTTGNHDFVKISWIDQSAGDNGFEAWFDLSTGNVGTAQATGTGSYTASSAFMTDIGGGRYRIGATGQIVSGQTDGRFEFINTTADDVDTAEATNSVFWSDFQVEEGAFATSITPTTTGAVTRSADVATIALSGVPGFSTTEGTIFTEHTNGAGITTNQAILEISDGGASDRLLLQFTSNQSRLFVDAASVNQVALLNGADWVANTKMRHAFAYAANDFAISQDGATVTTDTSGDMPTGLSQIMIGANFIPGVFLNGHIARLVYWNSRLPDSQLQALTAA